VQPSSIYEDLRRAVDEKASSFLRSLVVILNAAGEGLRLKPFTDDLPKALIPVGREKRPIIYWTMLPLLLSGISTFVIGVRYRGGLIKERLGHGEGLSEEVGREVRIEYIEEPGPLGRAGCVKYGLETGLISASNPTLIMNASDILKIDVEHLAKHYLWHRANYGFEVIQVYTSGYQVQYGIARLHPTTGRVLSFVEKPFKEEPANIACYCLQERLSDFLRIERIPTNPEDDLVYRWMEEGILGSYVLPRENVLSFKFVKDIERIESLDLREFLSNEPVRAWGPGPA